MVGRVFPWFSLKLQNVWRKFGRHIGPSGIMQNGIIRLVKSGMLRDAKYGIGGFGGGFVCVGNGLVPWEGFGGFVLLPWEEVSPPPPCEGELVDGWPWELDPRKVEPSKADPKIVALTGVWHGWSVELERLGTPPRIGGRFCKHLEWWGLCESLMVSD